MKLRNVVVIDDVAVQCPRETSLTVLGSKTALFGYFQGADPSKIFDFKIQVV